MAHPTQHPDIGSVLCDDQSPKNHLLGLGTTVLPFRPNPDSKTFKDAAPPPGHALTGKQEHCEWT